MVMFWPFQINSGNIMLLMMPKLCVNLLEVNLKATQSTWKNIIAL